jgi:hypothetical protein
MRRFAIIVALALGTLMPVMPAASSAPGVLEGPDTYSRFTATVTSVKKVTLRIANSDVSSLPPQDYWEVEMKVVTLETFEIATNSSLVTVGAKEKKLPTPSEAGRVLSYHFPITDMIRVGFVIEGTTKSKSEMNSSWLSQNSFLASYAIIPKR